MTPIEALVIISALADGTNPLTGDTLPTDSVYQQPSVIRALCAAVLALTTQSKPKKERPEGSTRGARSGAPWDKDEEDRLATAFDEGVPLDDIVTNHQRTKVAVEARLLKLGKIEQTSSGFVPRGRL